MVKRVLAIILATFFMVSSLTDMKIVKAVTENSYFKFEKNSSGGYDVSLSTDADFSSITSVEFPSTYESKEVTFTSVGITNNTNIKSVSIPTATSGNEMAFRGLNALEKVEYTNYDSLTFNECTFKDCSSTLKDVFIYASKVSFNNTNTSAKNAFFTFRNNTGAKIHVVSESVKKQIIDGTKNGSYPIDSDKIIVIEDERPQPTIKVTCENIKFHTIGGFKPKATVSLEGKPMETQPTVTYILFSDEACTQKFGVNYNYDYIIPGKYYLKASIASTEAYREATAVIPVEVLSLPDKVKLQEAVDKAKGIFNGEDVSSYTEITLLNLYRVLIEGYNVLYINESDVTADEIEKATNDINKAINSLVKKIIEPQILNNQQFLQPTTKASQIIKEKIIKNRKGIKVKSKKRKITIKLNRKKKCKYLIKIFNNKNKNIAKNPVTQGSTSKKLVTTYKKIKKGKYLVQIYEVKANKAMNKISNVQCIYADYKKVK